MELKRTEFERWQEKVPPLKPRTLVVRPKAAIPADESARLSAAALKAAVSHSRSDARFKFLTADGQTATPLEQEALLGTNDLVEASFLDRCLLVRECVGRIRFLTPSGRAYATGFMIAPGLMMTNHHVFKEDAAAEGAIIEFGYRYDIAGQLPRTMEFDLIPDQFFVADKTLDFAVVAVSPVSTAGSALARRGYLRLNPQSGKAEVGDFVTIVQHPSGEAMQIALRENEITRASQEEDVLWYQADTAHGSSGAPVFNDSFQIAALHSSGRIKRNERNEYALKRGGWAASIEGLSESDVIWEANVGIRVSRICERLLEMAATRSPENARTLETAMQGGDVLAGAIERIKSGLGEATGHPREDEMKEARNGSLVTVRETASALRAASELVIPLTLRISLESGDRAARSAVTTGSTIDAAAVQLEAFKMQIPVIFDGLDERGGFDRRFLELADGSDVPMPVLTDKGSSAAAPLIDGSGKELRYHKFSVWMHKDRRLALFTASNVDWRARKKIVDGKKTDRDTLAGFPPDALLAEQWVSDPRISSSHQLPDIFYTEDRGAFDKGHLVRRDDVCWGATFEDIQMGNGDTYHVTNCSPQIKPFNQGAAGEDNWGDLESHVQAATKKDQEKVVIYAGPIFKANDRWFSGKDDAGATRVQIPSKFWKIVVTKGGDGNLQAYGFVLEQDVRPITEAEFFVTDEWIGSMKKLSTIQSKLRGWISLEALKPFDQYDEVH